ncbi:Prophage integrase IntS [Candidatus Magnetaquicoccaceae bacterium FCR-1]|uniref:Prophage integrase IntS n=1 Tax=Candidatus Magnetaquiglobus chichijimensis TaxID=3141448 RepID=A0ABQ0CB43_9PROT
MRLIKTAIDRLPFPESGQVLYFDDTLKGFGLRVTMNCKTFIVDKRIEGKKKRITVGRHGELTVEQARKEAQRLLGEIATGEDPIANQREEELRSRTLEEVFKEYLASRQLAASTVRNYRLAMDLQFADWKDKPFLSITKDKVERRHALVGKERGEPFANHGGRVLRALFNFAAGKYEDAQGNSLVRDNPVRRLSQVRSWFRETRRQTLIKSHDLPAWYAAVMRLENTILRDYLLLLIFTGLRREEGARLRWAHVDLAGKTLTIPDTKNHEPHTLPLSEFLFELLSRRRRAASESAEFVFPGSGAGGHLVEPRAQMRKITEQTGIHFTVHDLRRTFITMAESLDIPAYALKKLLNHRTGADVTSGYLVIDVERLRGPMEKISAAMLSWMRAGPLADVVLLRKELVG